MSLFPQQLFDVGVDKILKDLDSILASKLGQIVAPAARSKVAHVRSCVWDLSRGIDPSFKLDRSLPFMATILGRLGNLLPAHNVCDHADNPKSAMELMLECFEKAFAEGKLEHKHFTDYAGFGWLLDPADGVRLSSIDKGLWTATATAVAVIC